MSGRPCAWSSWWTRTSPSIAMSAIRTRATPSGIRSTAEISATDRQSRQNPRMAWHSGLSTDRSRSLVVRRGDHRLDLKLVTGLGPAAGNRVRADQSAGLVAVPRATPSRSARDPAAAERAQGRSRSPGRRGHRDWLGTGARPHPSHRGRGQTRQPPVTIGRPQPSQGGRRALPASARCPPARPAAPSRRPPGPCRSRLRPAPRGSSHR